MKKAIFLLLILQWVFISPGIAGDGEKPVTKEIMTTRFNAISINADVTIQLTNSSDGRVQVVGSDLFVGEIRISQKGNVLVIDAAKNRNYKKKGVILIPAATLRYMEINSTANVSSAKTLAIPHLDVLVNGACHLNIVNKGMLTLNESKYYSVNYVMRDALYPYRVIDRQENQ